MKHHLLLWLRNTLRYLSIADDYAVSWVASRMEFQRVWLKGRILTTEHGLLFQTLLSHVDGTAEYDGKDREYIAFIATVLPTDERNAP